MLAVKPKWLFNNYTIHLDSVKLKLVSIARETGDEHDRDVVRDARRCRTHRGKYGSGAHWTGSSSSECQRYKSTAAWSEHRAPLATGIATIGCAHHSHETFAEIIFNSAEVGRQKNSNGPRAWKCSLAKNRDAFHALQQVE